MEIRIVKENEINELIKMSHENNFELNRDWDAIRSDPKGLTYVAVDDEKIVGYTGLEFTIWNHSAMVRNIFVLPEYRKRGIAAKLINKMVDIAKEKKLRVIFAEAPIKEGMVFFYKKIGFRICGYNDAYYDVKDNFPFWMCIEL